MLRGGSKMGRCRVQGLMEHGIAGCRVRLGLRSFSDRRRLPDRGIGALDEGVGNLFWACPGGGPPNDGRFSFFGEHGGAGAG